MNDAQMLAKMIDLPAPDLRQASKIVDPLGSDAAKQLAGDNPVVDSELAHNPERTLATKELEVTKLREALGFYANPENYLPKQVDGLFAGYVHGKIHDFDRGAIAVDTLCLSTPITKDTPDIPMVLRPTGRTIPDLTKREHVCEWQNTIMPKDAPAPAQDGETFVPMINAFREHYLRAIECNEETHQDKPHCACSTVDLGWHSNVCTAVDAWHAHVLEVAREDASPSLPAQPTEQPK